MNKLMISVRRHYYEREEDEQDIATATIRFGTRSGYPRDTTTTTTTVADMTVHDIPDVSEPTRNEQDYQYEMQDFSERAGF